MSKTQLKKELASLSSQQLFDLLIDLYDSKIDAKSYLEFFINPDIKSRIDKAQTLIRKELGRASRGRSKARITRLRKFITDITALSPGAEAECEILTIATEEICRAASEIRFKETTLNSLSKIIQSAIMKADNYGLLSQYLPRIEKSIEQIKSPFYNPNPAKKILITTLHESLKQV